MIAIFRNAFVRSQGAILGWGLSLGLLGIFLMSFYNTLAAQKESLEKLLSAYPPELMAFLGDFTTMFTPEGYLSVEYFALMPIVLGIFVVVSGSGLLASDEENGMLDLLLAYPVSRTRLFLGRLLAFIATTLGILGLMWLSMIVGMRWSSIDLSWDSLARPYISLWAVLMLFGTLALLMSMLLPSRRLAASVAGLFLTASYFITSFAHINSDLKDAAKFSPLNYYQSGDAIRSLNGEWLFGLLTVAVLFTLFAWWRFERRDIRVGGEGGWHLPRLSRQKPVEAADKLMER